MVSTIHSLVKDQGNDISHSRVPEIYPPLKTEAIAWRDPEREKNRRPCR
jgi:hypothetical protein